MYKPLYLKCSFCPTEATLVFKNQDRNTLPPAYFFF